MIIIKFNNTMSNFLSNKLFYIEIIYKYIILKYINVYIIYILCLIFYILNQVVNIIIFNNI